MIKLNLNYSTPAVIRNRSLVASASRSKKKDNKDNEDAHTVVHNRHNGMTGVIVADGVGSFYRANVASMIVTTAIKSGIEANISVDSLDLKQVFSDARSVLSDQVERSAELLTAGVDPQRAYGTTAICAVDVGDTFKVGYVGNGCLFHLRGNFDQISQGRLLPSNMANLLNPHCQWHEGRSVLARIISPTTSDAYSTPTIVQFSHDELLGDILVLASDGIYSFDDVQIGRDSTGEIFIEAKRSMVWLYEAIGNFLSGDLTEIALQDCLESYVRKLEANHLVDDDCTVAVLVSWRALRYRRSLRRAEAEELAVAK